MLFRYITTLLFLGTKGSTSALYLGFILNSVSPIKKLQNKNMALHNCRKDSYVQHESWNKKVEPYLALNLAETWRQAIQIWVLFGHVHHDHGNHSLLRNHRASNWICQLLLSKRTDIRRFIPFFQSWRKLSIDSPWKYTCDFRENLL